MQAKSADLLVVERLATGLIAEFSLESFGGTQHSAGKNKNADEVTRQ